MKESWVCYMLAGIEGGRIEPGSPAGNMLMGEGLPEEFWTRLATADGPEQAVEAYRWGREWIEAHWPDLKPDWPESTWRRQDGSPLSPSPGAGGPAPGQERAGIGVPEDGGDAGEDPGEQEDPFIASVNALLDACDNLNGAVKEGRNGPELDEPVRAMNEAAEAVREFFEHTDDPIQNGWVSDRGLP